MKSQMRAYFDRLEAAWRDREGSLPRAPWSEEADPTIYVGEVDEDEWVEWRPQVRGNPQEFGEIEEEFQVQIHSSVKAYFGSYYFCLIGGRLREWQLQLEPVLPGIELRDFFSQLRGYVSVHGGRLAHVPIGLEAESGGLVVVANDTGRVLLEDDAGGLTVVSESLERLISDLEV